MSNLKSVYINNYKCLQNFELNLAGVSDLLLLAKNGMGKSSVLAALRVLRKIALGETNISKLFKYSDFAFGNTSAPIRFKVVVAFAEDAYEYEMAVGMGKNGRLVVETEILKKSGSVVFSHEAEALFSDDRLMLPLRKDARAFCAMLADWILVMPIPSMMKSGRTNSDKLDFDGGNFIVWLKRILSERPDAQGIFDRELHIALPDCISYAWNDTTMDPTEELYLTFGEGADVSPHTIAMGDLSDGEKISVLGAALIALAQDGVRFLCFWDEPDNYLAVSEVQGFITRLRKYLRIGGCQLIISSHNVETIRTVGIDSTKILHRASHREPAQLLNCADKFKSDEARNAYMHNVLSGEIYED